MNDQVEIPPYESETVEFKKSFGLTEEIIETVVAFANRRGGEVWVGVLDNGLIVGTTIGANTFENFSNQTKGKTSPPLNPEISQHEIDRKIVAKIKVYEGSDKPYLAHGRGYIRVEKTNQVIERAEFERLLLERIQGKALFDTQISRKFSLEDISKNSVRWYLGRLRSSGRYEYVNEEMPIIDF